MNKCKILLSIVLPFSFISLFFILFFSFYNHGDQSEPIYSQNVTQIIVLSGQSNMVGYGTTSELNASLKQVSNELENIHIYDGQTMTNIKDYTKVRFGPELGLAHYLHKKNRTNTTTIFIKIAFGGLSIDYWAENQIMYKILINATNHIISEYDRTKIIGLLWMQGESDAIARESDLYFMKFQTLLQKLHELFNITKTISGLIFYWDNRFFSDIKIVNDALRILSTDVVDTKNFTLVDSIHFDTESTFELGQQFGRLIL